MQRNLHKTIHRRQRNAVLIRIRVFCT